MEKNLMYERVSHMDGSHVAVGCDGDALADSPNSG
ncbi:hypothetical protein SUDANB96_04477 [Streptomyces sp. enrichment culture]